MEVIVTTTNERVISIKGTLNDIADLHEALDPPKKRTKKQNEKLVAFAKFIVEGDRDVREIVDARRDEPDK